MSKQRQYLFVENRRMSYDVVRTPRFASNPQQALSCEELKKDQNRLFVLS